MIESMEPMAMMSWLEVMEMIRSMVRLGMTICLGVREMIVCMAVKAMMYLPLALITTI